MEGSKLLSLQKIGAQVHGLLLLIITFSSDNECFNFFSKFQYIHQEIEMKCLMIEFYVKN
jgi:hypothetical protein